MARHENGISFNPHRAGGLWKELKSKQSRDDAAGTDGKCQHGGRFRRNHKHDINSIL